jgi:prepilin-type N-terminal cleavage/methylation domain-containing protein
MRRQAFTLIELLAVITLLVIIAAITMVSLASPIGRARFSRDQRMITEIDGAMRSRARQMMRPVRLQIVPREGALIAEEKLGNSRFSEFARFQLSKHTKIARFETTKKLYRRRKAFVDYSPRGESLSYGLELTDNHGNSTWVVLCGMSGQAVVLKEVIDFEKIFSYQAALGPDYD